MGKAISAQHPAVVLRSHHRQLRALLAVAMIAVVGLSAAVVILATNDDRDTSAGSVTQPSAHGPTGNTRYDGGPEEGTAALTQRAAPATVEPDSITSPPGVRYDGGPEEGTRATLSSNASSNAVPNIRYDGGPEEGSRGSGQ